MDIILGVAFWVAIIWMIVIAFKSDQWGWAIGMFIIFPVCYLYGVLHWDRAKVPSLILILTTVLAFMFIDIEA